MALTRFSTNPIGSFWNDPVYDITPWRSPSEMMEFGTLGARNLMQPYSAILNADIVEGPDDYHVYVDLPGVDPADLDVTVANGQLFLKAERRKQHEENTAFTHRIERSFGRVQRTIALPAGANEATADAKFQNGVLSVRFDKGGAMLGRKIPIT